MPVFEPSWFTTLFIHKIYNVLIIALVTYLLLSKFHKKKKISSYLITLIMLEAWIILATTINMGDFSEAIKRSFLILLVYLIVDKNKYNITSLLNILMLHFEICIYGNLLSRIIFPGGLYKQYSVAYGNSSQWLLGVGNNYIFWLIPGLIVANIFRLYTKSNFRSLMLFVAITATTFLYGSSTCKVGYVVFIACMIIPFKKFILSPTKSIIIAAVIIVSIVLLQKTSLIQPIVENVIGKTLTFSGRVYIWKNAVSAIINKPLFGYGIRSGSDMVSYLGYTSVNEDTHFIWQGATHCHDEVLQITFEGGIIGLALFISLYVFAIKGLIKGWPDKISQGLCFGLFACTIMGITEVLESPLIYIIFSLSAISELIVSESLLNEGKTKRSKNRKIIFKTKTA